MEPQPQKIISRRCNICVINVRRASINKHLKSKKYTENQLENDILNILIILDWMFTENKTKEQT